MKNKQQQNNFVPGLALSEGFYHEAVGPILGSYFGATRHSAGLIGPGSEVLGYDTEMSTDHHWDPRVMIFLDRHDFDAHRDRIKEILSVKLPKEYQGYPTNFTMPDPNDNGVQIMRASDSVRINHRVEMYTIEMFFNDYLNFDINTTIQFADWLTFPFQKLRSIVSGRVFHDDLGLEQKRRLFRWYPHDIWLYIMASVWARIGQEEHLMGRAGIVGDEIGSAIIGSRLVRDIICLAFLMECEYPPYSKWLGTAFSRLKSAKKFVPVLTNVIHAKSWTERESQLSIAYTMLAEMHNNLGVTESLSTEVSQFFGRPFLRVDGERFIRALIHVIQDPAVRLIAERSPIGSVDILSDNSDLLEDPAFRPAIKRLYD